MRNKKVLVLFLAVVLFFLLWLQKLWSSKPVAKKPVSKAKTVQPLKLKKQKFLLVKQAPKQQTVQLGAKTKLPSFLLKLWPKANFTNVQTEQQGQAQLTTADFTVFSHLTELESSLINKLSKDWVLLRESSQPEIGFNLIFSQLETEKTLAFFAVKKEVSLKEAAKPLVRVSVLCAEKVKR